LKAFSKALLALLAIGLFYFLLTLIVPHVLWSQLEKSAHLTISGQDRLPFLLGRGEYAPLSLEQEGRFHIEAEKATIRYDALKTLLGQIPLEIQAENITLHVDNSLLNLMLSSGSFETLDAKITVFSGKGIEVRSFNLKGSEISLEAKGRLVKKGQGSSDLKATLWINSGLLEREMKPLVQDLLTRERKKHTLDDRVKFDFLISGDLSHPLINLTSDLIRFSVREKEVIS